MRIVIVGVGLIGGSIGLAARRHLEEVEVIGFGRSRERLERAMELGAIDRASESLEWALEGASACFACGPVGALPEQVAAALVAAPEDCVVSDVGSTKQRLVEAIDDERFIGGHPVAGSETAGVEHARADLFQAAVWYLTPRERSSGLLYERLHRLIVSFGARPVAIGAGTHDRLLATVSHLPHVLANVLVSQAARELARGDEPLPRAGPSFRDATRVAGASSAIWTDIYLANREAIAAEIDETISRLREVAGALRAGDAAEIGAWNERAAGDRRRLLEADLAGGPVHELRLTVPNRPGIVAQVALALGKADVNIVDMTLAPAADMRSGAMTLWIAGDDEAARARDLIGELGFPVG
jgi:prephenate dehydrogenase